MGRCTCGRIPGESERHTDWCGVYAKRIKPGMIELEFKLSPDDLERLKRIYNDRPFECAITKGVSGPFSEEYGWHSRYACVRTDIHRFADEHVWELRAWRVALHGQQPFPLRVVK